MRSAIGASKSAARRLCRVYSLRFSAGFVALALAIASPSFCKAQVTGLGTAGNYGILVDNAGPGKTNGSEVDVHSSVTANVTGSVGLVNGAGIEMHTGAVMSISGTLYYDSTAITNPVGGPGAAGFSATGGQNGSDESALVAAWNAATAASTADKGLTANTTMLSSGSGASQTNSITGTNSVNVVSLSSIDPTNGTLTINGNNSGNQVFVINVSGSVTLANVVLGPGVTASQVLFNVTGTGGVSLNTSGSGNGTVYGTFLDTSTNSSNPGISMGNSGTTTLNGALIAGGTDNSGGVMFGGGSTINTDSFVPTPELSTISMASVAFLLVLGGAGLRRVRRARAAA